MTHLIQSLTLISLIDSLSIPRVFMKSPISKRDANDGGDAEIVSLGLVFINLRNKTNTGQPTVHLIQARMSEGDWGEE